jgi:pimeloyl-ACP methyl ester carboxylesterase
VAVLCAAVTVLVSAWSSAPAPAAVDTSTAADLPPGGVPGVPVPAVEWADAGDGYQQATAQVPYDYARPRGRAFSLHLVRRPATDPAHRMGSLFVNFGGPGYPAADTVRTAGEALLPPEVLARYDLVGVDPRGTGESEPIRCADSSTEEQQSLTYVSGQEFPTDPAEEAEAAAQAARFAAQCRARNGDLLDHVGTLAFARDLDVLRAALGDARINLLGFSYGTFLGQVVANVFPDRTGAIVLDSVVDPAWATGARGSVDWIRENADVGSAAALQRFFQLCAEAGAPGCAFAADGDPQRRFADLAARLRTTPLAISLPGQPVQELGYDELVIITGKILYFGWAWETLGRFLHAVDIADAEAGAAALAEVIPPPDATGYDNIVEANAAIACADTDNPRDMHRYGVIGRERDATVAPFFGSWWASQARVCGPWQGRSSERYAGPWTARTSAPVLLLNNRYDPATPYGNAVHVHDLLPNSALLTVDGVGHGALPLSSCASDATAQYLLTGAVPPPGTACGQDLAPFDQPPA